MSNSAAVFLACAMLPALASAADEHDHDAMAGHTMTANAMSGHVMSGLAHGMPRLCADANVHTLRNGKWTDASIWSSGKVPGQGDAVLITTQVNVTYDLVSTIALRCVDVEGVLRFNPKINTRLNVGTLTVLQTGTLEIGTPTLPVAANVKAEIVINDEPLDTKRDPEQLGMGLIGLGKVTMHGAVKSPTFVRLSLEPLKGATVLESQESLQGWAVGDKLVLPDTRQLLTTESRANYVPQWESLRVASISTGHIALTNALEFDHHGARDGDAQLAALPHVGNVTRNVIVRSANPNGTRGHVIFVGRPDVDIRYSLFEGLGRTQLGVLDNVEYGADGHVAHVGDNQIGRYSLHMHHVFGPVKPQQNGYQFTLIGNAIDDASKWGITIHNSHYGLILDNVVYDSKGAGIVTEDGTESFNVFAHNFAVRSQGSGEFAPRSGYSGSAPDPGGEGAGFWFRGPNNYIRDNVAANTEVFGYGIAAGALDVVRIPKFQGADTSQDGQYVLQDTTTMPLLEFTHNEAYGAIQTGVAVGWNGVLADSSVWHTTVGAVVALLTDSLEVNGLSVWGDPAVLTHEFENPAGIWFGDYTSKNITVRRASIEGMRTGVESPFFMNRQLEPGRGNSVASIENSYLRDYVGVAIGTAYVDTHNATPAPKQALVRDTRFKPLTTAAAGRYAPAAISMNYGTSAADQKLRSPIEVHGFNGQHNDDFKVFYSNQIPATKAACGDSRPGIDGFVCGISP
jgi:hypothetical protein